MKVNYQHFVMQNIPRFQKEGGAIITGGAIFRGNTVCVKVNYVKVIDIVLPD